MTEISITKKLKDYIEQQKIPVEQTAQDLGIDPQKLRSENREDLSAGEFLELCSYLNVRPEEL